MFTNRIGEIPRFDGQMKPTQCLLHGRILISSGLVKFQLVASFGQAESQRLLPESKVLGWDITVEEDVYPFSDGRWHRNNLESESALLFWKGKARLRYLLTP